MNTTTAPTTEQRAEASLGTSAEAIYRLVARTIQEWHPGGGTLLDVGCGTGGFWGYVRELFNVYIGADVIRYEGFPEGAVFRPVNLDTGHIDLPDGTADVVACVETIEHVENPRALVRELARLARPDGLVVITTPNQLRSGNSITPRLHGPLGTAL